MASRQSTYQDIVLGADDGSRPVADVLLEIFGDIDARVGGVESVASSVAELQQVLVDRGQGVIDEVIEPLVDRIRAAAEIGVIFTASSVSLVTVGVGPKSFVVVAADLQSFAPAAMLTLTASDAPTVAMYARKISYDRATGALEVEVLSAEGAGSYSSWTITAGSRVANATQMALTPIAGLDAATVQIALSQLFSALGSNPAFSATTATALADRYTKSQADLLLSAKAAKTTALTALGGVAPGADKVPMFSSDTGATLLPAGSVGKALLAAVDQAAALAAAGAAPIASPNFSGTPSAPTQVANNNSNRIATTAFVQAAIAALVNSSPAALDTLNELAAALGNDPNFAATIAASLGKRVAVDGAQSFTATEIARALSNLGVSAFVRTLLDDADAATFYATLGTRPAAQVPATLTPDKAFRRGNVLGAVAQSSGDPTGALIERGSNANGTFARFADGTLICWSPILTVDITTSAGNLYRSPVATWDMPAAFAVRPATIGWATGTASAWMGVNSSLSSPGFSFFSFESRPAQTVSLASIGRWF